MKIPRIEIVENNATSDQKAAITSSLLQYNDQMARPGLYADFAILLRDATSDEVVGGLSGQTVYGWTFVKLLVVPEAYRGQGLGRQLMFKAEALARQHESEGIWLDTFDFQARPFYEKLGYKVFGALEDGPNAHGRYFLKKYFRTA
ncbi:MAG TPA: GNAT family N-acetyltransferase [Rhizobium sp.]|nr:GNAT family N-acetyltransferase [Rhizobium sp.]